MNLLKVWLKIGQFRIIERWADDVKDIKFEIKYLVKSWNTRKSIENILNQLEEEKAIYKDEWNTYDDETDFGAYCACSKIIDMGY